MQDRWPILLAAGVGTAWLGFSPEAAALTDKQRLEKLERHMLELERRLEASEAENAQLRGKKPAAAPTRTAEPDVKALDQKVKVLERKLEVEHEVAEANAKKLPRIEDSPTAGLKITSPDGEHQLRLRGYVQADGRFFIDDSARNDTDTFTIRRARLNFDGTLWKYNDFRIAPDFAGSSPSLFDAYLDLHYFPFASLTPGKQKVPIGLERLQSATALTFAERAYPTQLQANRDIGVMLHGEFAKPDYSTQYGGPHNFNDFFTYQVGVFNGGADNQSPANSTSASFDNKAFEGRIFAHPFQHSGLSLLEGLGLGVGGSWGDPTNQTLPSLVSPGQASIVTYLATAKAVNERYRIYPQLYWYTGPFGLLGEYVLSTQELNANKNSPANDITQNNRAYQVAASYVVTGEDNTFQGVRPRRAFDPLNGNWGALQLATRWNELDIDDATFRNFGTSAKPVYLYADPTKSVSKASSWAVGASWWLNPNVKIMADYEQTHFTGGAGTTTHITDRQTEKVFFTRFQLAY
jgi:phosphate-selective porin OprO/OprP